MREWMILISKSNGQHHHMSFLGEYIPYGLVNMLIGIMHYIMCSNKYS